MPRRLFIGLFLLPLPLFAAPPKDELAYAVGARLGMRLQQEMPGLELSELLLGLRQAYRGEALEIPPERIEQLLLQHENATTETPRTTPAEARFL
ncbi:FKBP-type peptidyl-prolyl cis-trans isomerase N-terminal domain-containing protein, partial [Pseudomonas aeruginosa]